MNRWSTAGFVPPSVCMGFLFVLPRERLGGYPTIVWGLGRSVVSLASRPVGVPSCLFPPRPAVPPCAAPSRPARGMSGFWIRQLRFYIRFIYTFLFPEDIQDGCPRCLEVENKKPCFGRTTPPFYKSAQPRPAPPRCHSAVSAPPRFAREKFKFGIQQIFSYASHEKELHRQTSNGPMVSNKEGSADSVTRGVRSERVLEVRAVARHAQEQVL